MMKPQPTKQHRIVCWHLVYRVPVPSTPQETDERHACERACLSWEAWQTAKVQFPQLMARVNEKRTRRRHWQECFDQAPPDGWTPPDPSRRISGYFPAAAMTRWRQRSTCGISLGLYGEVLDRVLIEEEAMAVECGATEKQREKFVRAGAMQCGKTPVAQDDFRP